MRGSKVASGESQLCGSESPQRFGCPTGHSCRLFGELTIDDYSASRSVAPLSALLTRCAFIAALGFAAP